jgi:hypothetical protein
MHRNGGGGASGDLLPLLLPVLCSGCSRSSLPFLLQFTPACSLSLSLSLSLVCVRAPCVCLCLSLLGSSLDLCVWVCVSVSAQVLTGHFAGDEHPGLSLSPSILKLFAYLYSDLI